MEQAKQLRRILRRAEVEKYSPVSDKTRRKYERLGLFPRRVRIAGSNLCGWYEDEVVRWQSEQLQRWERPAEHADV